MNDKVDFLEKQINSDFSNELSKDFYNMLYPQ